MIIPITYDLAMAAGRDAANRQMSEAKRTAWNEDDYNRAVEIFWQLFCDKEEEPHE